MVDQAWDADDPLAEAFAHVDAVLARLQHLIDGAVDVSDRAAPAATSLSVGDLMIREAARLFSDSQYTVKGCNEWRHAWKGKGWLSDIRSKLANVDLWLELDAALTTFPIRLKWVKGHAGIAGNVRADKLSWAGFRTLDAS